MTLWDVSLCLSFVFVIEDTVNFKFGGICVGIRVGSVLFCFFIIFVFIFIFAWYRFSSVLVCFGYFSFF